VSRYGEKFSTWDKELHALVAIGAEIAENNVRSMTFILMRFHLPNNIAKSSGATYEYDQMSNPLQQVEKSIFIKYFLSWSRKELNENNVP
jgi:hypothetical protein